MASPNLSEIITTTLRQRQGEIIDNVTDNNALLAKLKQRGNIKMKTGGRTIVKELDYAENSTFKWYTGYEALDVTASDVISAAEFDWKQASVNVVISGLEERQNSGENAILDLLEARITNAMRTMENNINVGLLSDGTGTGGKQLGGLQLIVADAPATGTVGGINRANFSFWRNISYDATTDGGAAASSTNIITYMNATYNQVIYGNSSPDLLVADDNYFGFYESALQSNIRFADSRMADTGFLALKYKGADVVLDNSPGMPANHMYMLNTEFLFLDVHQDANFSVGNDKSSVNQDATVVPLIFMGNMTASNCQRQAVLKD